MPKQRARAADASYGIITFGDHRQRDRRAELSDALADAPIPPDELPSNLGLYVTPQLLSRFLLMDRLYQQILEVPGIVVEFGCRWGQNLALFSSLRGIYEPFNRHRRIVGFDTFRGFPAVSDEDGPLLRPGAYAVPDGYEEYLSRILALQEAEGGLPHLTRFELVVGDVTETLDSFLADHPETVIALAYFDLDLYRPTKACLETIRPRLTRGSVLGFDDLNAPEAPGETLALREVFGLDRYRLRRSPFNARASYLVID